MPEPRRIHICYRCGARILGRSFTIETPGHSLPAAERQVHAWCLDADDGYDAVRAEDYEAADYSLEALEASQ